MLYSVHLWNKSKKLGIKNVSKFAQNWFTAKIYTRENYHLSQYRYQWLKSGYKSLSVQLIFKPV